MHGIAITSLYMAQRQNVNIVLLGQCAGYNVEQELDSCLMYHLIVSLFGYQYFENCYFGKTNSIFEGM
jgi:hypothetical protein